MAHISPTVEAFRVAFRRPTLTLAEISWRWTAGATAVALFFFGFFEYLETLPVTNGELLFLRSRQPYLVAQAIAHILRGSLSRGLLALMIAALLMAVLWIIAASLGRIVTVRGLLDYFRSPRNAGSNITANPFPTLARLNFLRAAVALAAIAGLLGAAILAGPASPDSDPQPGLAFLIFLLLAALVLVASGSLNWLLSLAGMFAVRDGEDALGAISTAVSFLRERSGPLAAVSTWTGLGHGIAFIGATVLASLPLGFAPVVPWRVVLLATLLVTLSYLALADWLYMVRLAGYVCIAETPAALLYPQPPAPPPPPPVAQVAPVAPLQTTIDRDELILSDGPGAVES